jgi:adenosine deaminase
VQTRTCIAYPDHPVDRLFRAGVSLGINTDARTITNVTLEEEYSRLRENFGWGNKELLACNQEALRSAFLDEADRTRLLDQLGARQTE